MYNMVLRTVYFPHLPSRNSGVGAGSQLSSGKQSGPVKKGPRSDPFKGLNVRAPQ